MVKLLSLFKVFLLVGIVAFTSCTKEEPKPVLDLSPILNILEEDDCVSADVTLATTEEFKVKIWSEKNPYTQNELHELKIVRLFKSQSWDTAFQIEGPSLWKELQFCAQLSSGDEVFEVILNDKEGRETRKTLVITTE